MNIKRQQFTLIVFVILALLGVIVLSVNASTDAVINITTNLDELDGKGGNGNCSLREAIANANNDDQGQVDCTAGSGDDVISLPAATYQLSISGASEDGNTTGDLDITDNMQIMVSGKTATIQAGTASPVDGSCSDCIDRVFDIHSGVQVEFNNLIIQYGWTPDGVAGVNFGQGEYGGGIRNAGDLILNYCQVRYNRTGNGVTHTTYDGGTGGLGGGIYSDDGVLILNTSHVKYNLTGNGGAGDRGGNGGNGGWGGGIQIDWSAVLTMTNSTVALNSTGDGGPGADYINNHAGDGGDGGIGGGIQSYNGQVWIISSSVYSNTTGAGNNGGDVTSGNGDGGDGGDGGSGGGFYGIVDTSTFTLVNSSIYGNSTGPGGLAGSKSGSGSDGIDGDRGDGGAIYASDGTYILRDCTISGNLAEYSGGMEINTQDTIVSLTNCTISGNKADKGSGGIGVGSNSSVELDFVTITENIADYPDDGDGDGGGITTGSSSSVTVTNSIIAGNIDMGGEDPDCHSNALISGDYNLLGIANSSFCPFTSQVHDIVGSPTSPEDPLLGSLNNNGGNTHTHALFPSSPAIDQIPSGVNGCIIGITLDQRGVLRISKCDIGAYEFDLTNLNFIPLVIR